MIFIFHPDAGKDGLCVRGEEYKYLIKVRRHQIGDEVTFRNRSDEKIAYRYRLNGVDGREAEFSLMSRQKEVCEAPRFLHIGWCMVDPKTIEKTLPMLLELGVGKITFIVCERSQKQFRPDYQRLERIMESSMMQSGRTSRIEFAESKNLDSFLKEYPDTMVLDFSDTVLKTGELPQTVLIGCEGGFHPKERELFSAHAIRRFGLPSVLRSETAAVAVAALYNAVS